RDPRDPTCPSPHRERPRRMAGHSVTNTHGPPRPRPHPSDQRTLGPLALLNIVLFETRPLGRDGLGLRETEEPGLVLGPHLVVDGIEQGDGLGLGVEGVSATAVPRKLRPLDPRRPRPLLVGVADVPCRRRCRSFVTPM